MTYDNACCRHCPQDPAWHEDNEPGTHEIACPTCEREDADKLAVVTRGIERVLADHDHSDTCGSELSPDAGYPCNCWKADVRAALDGGE